MRNEERDYSWTRPGMRACVEKRLRELIVRPDGRFFNDDEVISMIKEQLVHGLLSHHVIAEGFNNVGCLQIDAQTETVDTESQACDVLRERLLALADDETTKGNAAIAEQVRRLAKSDFSSFSDIRFTSSAPVLVKGAMTNAVSSAKTKQQGGGGGGDREVVLKIGTGGESEPLLKTEDTSRERGCCIM